MKPFALISIVACAAASSTFAQLAVQTAPTTGDVSVVAGASENPGGWSLGARGNVQIMTPGSISQDHVSRVFHAVTAPVRITLGVVSGNPVFRLSGRSEIYPVTIQAWGLYNAGGIGALGLQIIPATVEGQYTLSQLQAGGFDSSRSFVRMSPQFAVTYAHVGASGGDVAFLGVARARVGGGFALVHDRDGTVPTGGLTAGGDVSLMLILPQARSVIDLTTRVDYTMDPTGRLENSALINLAGSLGYHVILDNQGRMFTVAAEARSDWGDVRATGTGAQQETGPAVFVGGSVGVHFR